MTYYLPLTLNTNTVGQIWFPYSLSTLGFIIKLMQHCFIIPLQLLFHMLQATLGSTSGEGTVARVGNAVNRTKQLLGDLQTVRDQAASNDDLSLTTSQKTDNSTRRITDSFTQAEDMLETMQNFDSKAKGYKYIHNFDSSSHRFST